MPDNAFQDEARNRGFDDYWTSPCCFADIPEKIPGVHDCPDCGRKVTCTVEHEPVALAKIEAD